MDCQNNIAERINELYVSNKDKPSFWNDIAEQITNEEDEFYTADRARGIWRRWKQKNNIRNLENNISDEQNVEIVGTNGVETLDELLEKSKVDLDVYTVDHFITNIWDGKTQIKAWLKKKTPDSFVEEEFLERLYDTIVGIDPPCVEKTQYINDEEETLFIPCLFDSHIESPFFAGDYVDVLNKLIRMSINSGYRPERILFPIGNDFGHFDNNLHQTTNGTGVQTKQTYLDSIDRRCSTIINSCNLLRVYTDNIDVIVIPGNHDRFSSYWLGKVLEAYYSNDKNVTVFNGQSPRKYYRYKNTLFGLTHGSDEKKMDLVGLMAVEAASDWALATNRIWLTGHLHQQNRSYNMLNEKFGVIQRIFPSLVDPDDWHILKGYIGNGRAAELLVYNSGGKLAEFQLAI